MSRLKETFLTGYHQSQKKKHILIKDLSSLKEGLGLSSICFLKPANSELTFGLVQPRPAILFVNLMVMQGDQIMGNNTGLANEQLKELSREAHEEPQFR